MEEAAWRRQHGRGSMEEAAWEVLREKCAMGSRGKVEASPAAATSRSTLTAPHGLILTYSDYLLLINWPVFTTPLPTPHCSLTTHHPPHRLLAT